MGHSFNHRPEREPRQPSGRRMHARHERYPFDLDSEFDEDDAELDFDLAPPLGEEFQVEGPLAARGR